MTDQLTIFDALADIVGPEPVVETWSDKVAAAFSVGPYGEELPDRHTWCGRCGLIVPILMIGSSHDGGYTGCAAAIGHDPTFQKWPLRSDGRGTGGHATTHPRGMLSDDELCERFDRTVFADCTCGHPWGLHAKRYNFWTPDPNPFCHFRFRCGCQEYAPEVAA